MSDEAPFGHLTILRLRLRLPLAAPVRISSSAAAPPPAPAERRCGTCRHWLAEEGGRGRCWSDDATFTPEHPADAWVIFLGGGYPGDPAPQRAYGHERAASDGSRCRWHGPPLWPARGGRCGRA